ncbi:tripartite tricarboxylate transporter substrate-binding protein [Variovorax sp. GT1P44]|uniref:tripartite tricarboxylate transporter substrate-binding protein n=1 Tax=Variovorax sp. GT1P44 TaxID=3443742 RepID=UPI003F490A6C
MVVGYLHRGAIESIARAVAAKLSTEFRQPLVLDSSPRVGGTLGLAVAARAAPDGLTLLMTSTTTMWVARHLYNELPDGPRGDFVPVALFSPLPEGFAANSSVSAHDLQARIDWLRKSGSKVDGIYAPPGTPGAIVDKLAAAIRHAIRTVDVQAQLIEQGVDLVLLTGPAARAFLAQD